jgi:hypothetical protein
MTYLLNSPILTSYGKYSYQKINREEVIRLLCKEGCFLSAIGHEGTAKFLSELLEVNVPSNRTAIKMEKGDKAVVFRLLQRLPEGKVLSREELESVPYEFGLLTKEE